MRKPLDREKIGKPATFPGMIKPPGQVQIVGQVNTEYMAMCLPGFRR